MSKPNAIRSVGVEHLSVIHNASHTTNSNPDLPGDTLLQTDINFNITGWNHVAEKLYALTGAMGKNIFQVIDIDFVKGSREELDRHLAQKSSWNGEIDLTGKDGRPVSFHTTVTNIMNATATAVTILFVCRNSNVNNYKEIQLDAAEKKYEILLNTLPEGVMIINKNGKIDSCNKRGAAIFGLKEDEVIGAVLASPSWKAIKADGSVFPLTEFPAVVSLQTGFPQRNVIMGMHQPDDTLVWLSVNSEALIHPGQFEPYAVVVSYSDITDFKKSEEELKKSNERFYHVSKVTSDAIWDIDLTTKLIYRSAAFRRLSGYAQEDIDPNIDWWFTNVHPEDVERVKDKFNHHLQKGLERWDDEYRFRCADGNYKFIFDSGVILYKGGKATRILGAIRDLTEQKKLEKQLLDEQVQRHKDITLAAIEAQEQEKTNISRELHDNVNQILMSAKLFMDTAKRMPEQSDELIDKAIEYQLLALQEIRKLTKSLSTSNVKTVGLKESVDVIVKNLTMLQQMEVEFIFNEKIEDKLSDDQKLMLFRIIQEQTSNIIKYAAAKSVQIMVNEANNIIHLVISDDGVGFDTSDKSTKGIGFLNIISRADVYNGKVNIISSPGNGCALEICFPID